MIKILVVEDSPVIREFLVHILDADPGIRVVGTARDGEDAIEAVARMRPDVITMDIHMPGMDGLEATRRIMETHPTPIVIVSGSTSSREVATTFNAMQAGALAFLPRPAGIGQPDYTASARELVRTVKLMAEVKVVRRWSRLRHAAPLAHTAEAEYPPAHAKVSVVAIGASTGGPAALHAIISALPADFPAPILIVQHMAGGFIQGFADWLAQSSRLPIHIAAHSETILSGHAYLAPDESHMNVTPGGKIALTQDPPEHGLRPSVSQLFRSVADIYGRHAVAGLLTGMGRDGADELKLLKDKGAITFAQDKNSSIVHGMPGQAIKLDAATLVLPLNRIAAVLANLANNGK